MAESVMKLCMNLQQDEFMFWLCSPLVAKLMYYTEMHMWGF